MSSSSESPSSDAFLITASASSPKLMTCTASVGGRALKGSASGRASVEMVRPPKPDYPI